MDRSAQNPGFFVSGGQDFLSSFLGSLSRRVDSGSKEPRTAQCSLRVSGSLQPRGRWARSGSQQSAGVVGVVQRAGAGSSGNLPAKLFFLEASSLLAIVLQVVDGSLLRVLTLPSENILMGVLAVMVRSSVLREDGGHLAPCRGRLGRC